MRHYEVVAVIHPDQQGRITAMIDLYKKIITDGGGVLHRLEDWGRRPLAYPIQNQHKAQYVLMNIECGNDTLDKLRESFRFSDSIIRSLVVRREKAITEPSIIKRQTDAENAEKAAAAAAEKQIAARAADSPPAKDSRAESSESGKIAAPVKDSPAAPAESTKTAAPAEDSPQPKESEQ